MAVPPQVLASLQSVESVDLLLLLRRSPDTFWTAEAAAHRLNIDLAIARGKLAQLVEAGLVVQGRESGAFRFAPSSDGARAFIDTIAAASEPRHLDRLRAFSDAFRWKKE